MFEAQIFFVGKNLKELLNLKSLNFLSKQSHPMQIFNRIVIFGQKQFQII